MRKVLRDDCPADRWLHLARAHLAAGRDSRGACSPDVGSPAISFIGQKSRRWRWRGHMLQRIERAKLPGRNKVADGLSDGL